MEHFGRIEGQPPGGVGYRVDASVSELESVRAVWFEMVNESSAFMERIPMVPDDTSPLDSGQFVGMLSVLKEPFRIVLCGVTHNGRRFTVLFFLAFVVLEVDGGGRSRADSPPA